MSKSNKLLMKLIRASGGWETFLYVTLAELCRDIAGLPFDISREAKLVRLLEDAVEIIEAYEDSTGEEVVENHVPKVGKSIEKVHKIQSAKPVKKIVEKPIEKPRKMKVKVGIDTDAGWCQGGLPIPSGYKVVNKDRLTVTTINGMEMARGSEDGQVKGQGDVSGQVSNKGKYRLVFKDVDLGAAFINFEVMPTPPAPSAPPVPVQPMQITPAMVAAKAAAKAEPAKVLPVDDVIKT